MRQGKGLSLQVGLAVCDQFHGISALQSKPVHLACICRVRVSQDGQFLHYIFPYQFLDSPEWESLRPSEEGTFQVTLSVTQAHSWFPTASQQQCQARFSRWGGLGLLARCCQNAPLYQH